MSPLDHLPTLIGLVLAGVFVACVYAAPVWLIVWSLALPPRVVGLAALLPPLALAAAVWNDRDAPVCEPAVTATIASAAIVGLAAWVSA